MRIVYTNVVFTDYVEFQHRAGPTSFVLLCADGLYTLADNAPGMFFACNLHHCIIAKENQYSSVPDMSSYCKKEKKKKKRLTIDEIDYFPTVVDLEEVQVVFY